MTHLKTNPFDERPSWVEEYTKRRGLTDQQGISELMRHQGIQGVAGQQGISGMQGVSGMQGEPGYTHMGKTVFNNDVCIDGMSVRDFVNNIPVKSIENAVLEILEKHGIYTKDSSVRIGGEIEDADLDADIEDKEDMFGTMGPNDDGVQDAYQKDKTFTLDEIITIIESFPVKMNINRGGIWEYSQEQLIDKNELIKKLKSL